MSLRELFRVEQLPVFQNKTFASADAAFACPKGDVVLVQDMETGLVFNSAFDPALLVYDADYQNEQACSDVFQKHLDDVAEIIDRHFHGKTLIEVGCGKGYFLGKLKHKGYRITGIDPAYEGDDPDVIPAIFESKLGINADGVILRHVLEHIVDPFVFLRETARANGGKGLIYIEVPCFDWILSNRTWFDIFYEHVNYFRIDDFDRMFGRVIESGRLFGGQYLYVVADLSSLKTPTFSMDNHIDIPEDFLSGVHEIAQRIRNNTSRKTIVWGASSKGVIFSIYMQRENVTIDLAVDINPVKQGRYLPVSGLRVASPEELIAEAPEQADIYVMNSNYLTEIRQITQNRFNYIKVG